MEHLVIACGVCGGDPYTDTMLVNAAIAGVLGAPWFFRDRIARMVRHLRGRPEPTPESCPVPREDHPE
jgi:hypothetical protein